MNLADITAIFCRYWSIFSKKYPWIINAIWKFFEKDQYYLFQSLCINKRIESFFFCENKSPGADEINFDIIKYCFGEVCGPFSHSTPQNMQLLSLQIRSTNHLRMTTTPLAFLPTCQRRLIQSIIQYFWKAWNLWNYGCKCCLV